MSQALRFVSFIIPAYNESFEISRCLESVFSAGRQGGIPFEVIVVNDASSDDTALRARQAGANVVDVELRKISAVRNAGARQAKGDVFFFIDADTWLPAETYQRALEALQHGCAGGGSWVRFGEPVSPVVTLAINLFSLIYMRLLRWAAGCFIFATREAFEAVGGFDESLYACEEIALSIALKKHGNFVVLRESVATSARKIRLYSPWRTVVLLIRLAIHGPAIFKQRSGLEWWYEGKREQFIK